MSWYVIYVKTGYEDEVSAFMNKLKPILFHNIKYSLLIPKRKIYERKQGIQKEVVKRLFPGYILVQTDKITEFCSKAKGNRHIIKFLKNGYEFLPVEDHEISFILKMMNDEGLIEISQAMIVHGKIRIKEGPLVGYENIIKKIERRKGRAKVEFILNRKTLLIDMGIEIL